MRNKTSVGIDIGTYQVKVVIAQESNDKSGMPKILGVGYAESKGLRHGYIINQTDAIRSIRRAVRQAEKSSGVKVDKAFISIGGIGLSSHVSTGHIIISRADAEVTELDIDKVNEEAKRQIPNNISMNRQIIHNIPIEYLIDGKVVLGNPVGMKGNKLEAKIMYVTCLTHHVNELVNAVENSGIEIIDAVASPLAAGIVNLSRTERMAGCVMINIGSETVSMVVYEEDVPISLEVFKVGSNDITNDIALGMQVSLDEAEKLKQQSEEFMIEAKSTTRKSPEGRLQNIIVSRLSTVFDLVDDHLKKIDRSGLLPAGIILTGGGSGITSVEDLAKASLKLPSRIAGIANHRTTKASTNDLKVKDSTWSVAYGLCVYGMTFEDEDAISFGKGLRVIKNGVSMGITWFKKFLP
jgi:cell division protein FtsA